MLSQVELHHPTYTLGVRKKRKSDGCSTLIEAVFDFWFFGFSVTVNNLCLGLWSSCKDTKIKLCCYRNGGIDWGEMSIINKRSHNQWDKKKVFSFNPYEWILWSKHISLHNYAGVFIFFKILLSVWFCLMIHKITHYNLFMYNPQHKPKRKTQKKETWAVPFHLCLMNSDGLV